jgi:hypothetical protein
MLIEKSLGSGLYISEKACGEKTPQSGLYNWFSDLAAPDRVPGLTNLTNVSKQH